MGNSHLPRERDEELALRALLGDLEAFDALVRRFRGAVLRITTQILGSREAAEDAAQETFLLAFKALPQLQEPERFAGWLCAIARRCALRHAEKNRRNEPTDAPVLDRLLLTYSQELTASPHEQTARKVEQEGVTQALAQLSPDYRLPLELYYFEDWSVGRIADFLSLPNTTIKWRLHYGRTLLRRLLSAPEEKNDERQPFRRHGHSPDTQHAAPHGPHGGTRQPDREPGRWRAQCCPAI
jgi:RNA polymerase sigma-70 factor (ECF subfamily)